MKVQRKTIVALVVIVALASIVLTATSALAVNYVKFSAVTSGYQTNVRSGPSTSYGIVRRIPPNTRVYFDGWVYGSAVTDLWLGTPDYRWYKIEGRNEWIASGVVNGNAPGSSAVPPSSKPPSGSKNLFVRPIQTTEAWQYKGYGVYNWYIRGKYHTGADVAVPTGTRVQSTADGTVVIAGYNGGWGNVIVIRHWSPYWRQQGQWKYCYSQYAHLSQIHVRQGQSVRQYDHIGNVGSTGMSTGPHLHFEIKSQVCVDKLGILGPGYTTSHPDSYSYVNPWNYCSKW